MTNASAEMRPQYLMWTRPRAAFRRVLDNPRDRFWIVIMAAFGTGAAFLRLFNRGLLIRLPLWLVIIACLLSGLIFGPLQAYLMTAFLRFVAWLSGKPGTFRELRAAYAWSFLPNAVAGALLSVVLVALKLVVIAAGGGSQVGSIGLIAVGLVSFVVLAALLVGWGWSLVLLVIGVAEAHRTTTAEGFFQVLGAVVTLVVVAFLVVMFVVFFVMRFHSL